MSRPSDRAIAMAFLEAKWMPGAFISSFISDVLAKADEIDAAAPDGAQAVAYVEQYRVNGEMQMQLVWEDGERDDRDYVPLYRLPPSQDAEDAARYRWLRDRALYFDRQEDGDSREGTPYCVYGLDMGDATPTFGKELDAFVDDCMAIDAARAGEGDG